MSPELPNYFIADLPGESVLTETMLEEACHTLKRNRNQYLAGRTTADLVRALVTIGQSWLEPDYPIRQLALEKGPAATGFSRQTLEAGLDALFKQFTRENFETLIEQDLGGSAMLEEMSLGRIRSSGNRFTLVTGPELLLHVSAGNLPNPTILSMSLGLLLRSAQLIKCASGRSLLPRLFAHSVYQHQPKLGACLELVEWKGGVDIELEQLALQQADCITATGSDAAISSLRKRVPAGHRFVAYGQKVSFGFVSGKVLTSAHAERVIARAAQDVAAWDQVGCLSPHVFYVEEGHGLSVEQFAERLAEHLAQAEAVQPRGTISVQEAATITSRHGIYQLRAAHSPDTRLWASQNSTAWTVVYEVDPIFQLSCLNRFIYVKVVKNLEHALHSSEEVRGMVSTVGIAVPEHEAQDIATQLARWGVTRVCPIGQMQNPPLPWRHDGRPALGDLVRFTDWEA